MAHCPLPRSTELTDVVVNCDTNVLTIIQTAANGSESHQSVDLSCILPTSSRIVDVAFDCDTGQLTIIQETDGACTGGDCTETFIVDMSCLLEYAMPACDRLNSVAPVPTGSEIVICTPDGPKTTPPSALLPEFDCSNLPVVCCPRPPDIGIIACNDGGLVVVPPSDLLTCDDIPSVFPAPDPIEVVVCGGGSLIKIPPSELLKCEDFPSVVPPPADFEILACGGSGGLIKIPPHLSINCADIPVMNPPPDPSYFMLCSEGGMIKLPYDPSITDPPTIDINEGEGIDIDVSVNGNHTTYTISSDLCEYQDIPPEGVDNAGSIYFPICIDGGNGKIPLGDMENMFGGFMVDGYGTALSGDGSPEVPHKVDIALCELTEQPYVPAATLAICNGAASERMPAIKAGSNVIIDADGTLNVNIPATIPRAASILLSNQDIAGDGTRYPTTITAEKEIDPHGLITIVGEWLEFSVAGIVNATYQAGVDSLSGKWVLGMTSTSGGVANMGQRYPNSEWETSMGYARELGLNGFSSYVPAGGRVKFGGWSSGSVVMGIGEATVTFIEAI